MANPNIPLIELPTDRDSLQTVSSQIVEALQTSGFLLVKSSDIPSDLQESAIRVAFQWLVKPCQDSSSAGTTSSSMEGVIDHPIDPKRYLMLNSLEELQRSQQDNATDGEILVEYWKALERVKRQLLTCLAIGLELEPDYFVRLHSKDQSALRLLHYPVSKNEEATTSSPEIIAEPQIRCKPHSDYGSVTLLLTDGVPGLEAFINGEWISVPHVKGALVVNIGSLLQGWTNGKLLATLHRVVVPEGSQGLPRTSLAFFADPDPEISTILKDETTKNSTQGMAHIQSVADYIKWRSGGVGKERTGLAFSQDEEDRVNSITRIS